MLVNGEDFLCFADIWDDYECFFIGLFAHDGVFTY
jgi:hypothetical protein